MTVCVRFEEWFEIIQIQKWKICRWIQEGGWMVHCYECGVEGCPEWHSGLHSILAQTSEFGDTGREVNNLGKWFVQLGTQSLWIESLMSLMWWVGRWIFESRSWSDLCWLFEYFWLISDIWSRKWMGLPSRRVQRENRCPSRADFWEASVIGLVLKRSQEVRTGKSSTV